jgi:hypothetical protein
MLRTRLHQSKLPVLAAEVFQFRGIAKHLSLRGRRLASGSTAQGLALALVVELGSEL